MNRLPTQTKSTTLELSKDFKFLLGKKEFTKGEINDQSMGQEFI